MTNYKTNLSKPGRKIELALQARETPKTAPDMVSFEDILSFFLLLPLIFTFVSGRGFLICGIALQNSAPMAAGALNKSNTGKPLIQITIVPDCYQDSCFRWKILIAHGSLFYE